MRRKKMIPPLLAGTCVIMALCTQMSISSGISEAVVQNLSKEAFPMAASGGRNISFTPKVWSKIPEIIDNEKSHAAIEKARDIAGDDKYLQITQRLQCRDINAEGYPSAAPKPNIIGGEESAIPTKVFDNVYYIGGKNVGGWLITTSDGYILLDTMYDYSVEKTLLPGMKAMGLDPSLVKYILITHSGPDHIGGAKYFYEKFGTKIVFSSSDMARAEAIAAKKPNTQPWIKRESSIIGKDGMELTLGDTTITMVHTPRRVNGGGLSYLIPVKHNGEKHIWASYGNTNVVGKIEDKYIYRESVAKFIDYTKRMNADVVISSHPFVDGSLERMQQIRNAHPKDPNPFVIGEENVQRFLNILDQCALVSLARTEAGIDETGTRRL